MKHTQKPLRCVKMTLGRQRQWLMTWCKSASSCVGWQRNHLKHYLCDFFLIFKNVLLICRCHMYVQEHTQAMTCMQNPDDSFMELVCFFHLYKVVGVGLFGCLTFGANALLTEPCQSLVVISATGSHHSSSHELRACLLWKGSTNCQKQTVKGKNSS